MKRTTYKHSGSYRNLPKQHGQFGVRGVNRALRDIRRRDAETRNLLTPHDRTKAHRLNRCDPYACTLSSEAANA